jgi:hypothetical protein
MARARSRFSQSSGRRRPQTVSGASSPSQPDRPAVYQIDHDPPGNRTTSMTFRAHLSRSVPSHQRCQDSLPCLPPEQHGNKEEQSRQKSPLCDAQAGRAPPHRGRGPAPEHARASTNCHGGHGMGLALAEPAGRRVAHAPPHERINTSRSACSPCPVARLAPGGAPAA